MSESFLRKLFATLKCSICGKNYEAASIRLVGQEEGLWFLSAFCGHCRTQGLIVAVVEKSGLGDEASSDLTEPEHYRFISEEAVGVDDVVDMHNFLKEFNGDFAALFAQE